MVKYLTRQGIVSVVDVHCLCVGHTGLNLLALVPLPLSVPHKHTKHGHDDEEEKDNAHDSSRRVALRASCWANLSVWVELIHHQSCYKETDRMDDLNNTYRSVIERQCAANSPAAQSPLTLITADAFISGAAVARSSHIVTGSIVQALTQLLAAVSKRTSGTLCMAEKDIITSIRIKALIGQELEHLEHTQAFIYRVILPGAKVLRAYSTLLTASPNEAGSASTQARDVVTVCAVLAAADLCTVPAVEP